MTKKDIEDFKSAIEIIETNVSLFHKGYVSSYRVVATELYILLIGPNSLISRIFKTSALHPLKGLFSKIKSDPKLVSLQEGLIFTSPATIKFDGEGGTIIVSLFDESKKPIPIQEWLAQPIFNEKITIAQLIKSIRHKEGAHSNKKYDHTLRFTKSVKLVKEDIHLKYIIAIGEYVLKSLKLIGTNFKIIN